MGKKAAILMFLGVQIWFAASLNRSDIDKSSLLALKAHINSNILAKNWSQETSFCTWIGIDCSRRHPRVTSLNLSNMDLQGTIPSAIGNLSFLTFFDLSNNSINGLIPSEIGNLRRLRVLKMAMNQLDDRIPESLGLLRKLKDLNLSSNYLSGDIPTSLSTCVELMILDMSYNNLTGGVPVGFGNLSQLEYLHLSNNQFIGEIHATIFNISSLLSIDVELNQLSGTLPKDLCTQTSRKLQSLELFSNHFQGEILTTLIRCHSLKMLSLGRNAFTGTIPPSITNLSNLDYFDIQQNSFHGTIPSEIAKLPSLSVLSVGLNNLHGLAPQSLFNLSTLWALSLAFNNLSGNVPFSIDKGLPNLEELYLDDNLFHGNIPSSISNLSKLKILELSKNSFTGHIPITLGNLRRIKRLDFINNQLTNNMSEPEQDFISPLTSCNYLEFLLISGNPITGALPKSIGSGNFSASLVRFRAQNCRITGPIPSELGNLSSLFLLHLGGNNLTGVIPATLGKLSNLQRLVASDNELHGSISPVLCSLKNLFAVDLSDNSFVGQLPPCLGNLSMLRDITLSHNAFNSTIPSSLWLNDGVETIYLSDNFIDGSLPQEISNMKSLVVLDLSRNQLSGEIPSAISQLLSLISLSLPNNKLEGSIFESFADLKDLQYLDLSRNNLSGPIPKSLEMLSYLSFLNVSFNQLSGEIPDGGPFANFTAESFTGNKDLCGSPRFKVEACKRSTPTNSRKKKLVKYILPAAIALAVVVVVAIILVLALRRRGGNLSPPSLSFSPRSVMNERISYYEILRATNNLAEENLIGRGSFGSVYKGNFSDIAMIAAIKVFDLEVQGGLKSFDTESQIMRSIRHRNLVKVITSCSNLDFKALVMEYMPNGNLEKWLYSPKCCLNILQRLGIMVDVASAIEYLHEGYDFPIVHCDLKPDNILLDEEMAARVGDFGIAKLLTEEQRMQQTRTLGTIGYMAPEYGTQGLVTTMVDVYSYGILLMEILSRRKPTDDMFSGDLTMKRWVSESIFHNSVMQFVDDKLVKMDDQNIRDSLTSIVGLALECTADFPGERPNMKDVLARIKKIKLNLS